MWGRKEKEEREPICVRLSESENDNQKHKQNDPGNTECDDLNNNNYENRPNLQIQLETNKSEKIYYNRDPGNAPTKTNIRNKSSRKMTLFPAKMKKKVHFKDLGTKIKNKRDPLPMKLRALPHSFWQQPNHPADQSPAPLPPTLTNCTPAQRSYDFEVIQINTISNSNSPKSSTTKKSKETASSSSSPEAENNTSIISDANTELLFSLFNTVNNERKPTQRRGRPRKGGTLTTTKHTRDDDPCLVPSGLLSSISPSKALPDTPRTLNYSQLLNDLVFQL